jgi:hypothetical protein
MQVNREGVSKITADFTVCNQHPNEMARRPLRCERREAAKEQLRIENAGSYRMRLLKNGDSPLIPSAQVVRQARCDSLRKDVPEVLERLGASETSYLTVGPNFCLQVRFGKIKTNSLKAGPMQFRAVGFSQVAV